MLTGTVVLKENHLQIVSDEFGDLPSSDVANYGLYYYDTRYLSSYELRVNGRRPLYLSHSTDRNYIATFQFVNSDMILPNGTPVPRQTLSIRRTRFVDEHAFYERLGFFNCNHFPMDIDVTLTMDADFRDMLAVRGFAKQRLAGEHSRRFGADELVFSYVGRDRKTRHTVVSFSVQPEPLSTDTMQFRLHLEPHTPLSVTLSIRPSIGRRSRAKPMHFDIALERLARSYANWNDECTATKTNNEFFDASLLRQSRLDIRSLMEYNGSDDRSRLEKDDSEETRGGMIPSAGIPWYAVPFGRDAIIAALQTLMYNPAIAEGTLRFLASQQGRRVNRDTEEEPGKILHELRRGELANLKEIPHLPYFGTVDATPLFVILFVETMGWLGSEQLYRDLLPSVLAALEWCDQYGDLDGDGYIEYIPHREGGVRNQGWKDSVDSLQYDDGTAASLPAALVEVQGYVYHAKVALAGLVAQHHDDGLAQRLWAEASALRERFNRDFWMSDEQYYAQALDAGKSHVRSITSNVGHCLWSGIVDEEKAGAVVRRLMAPDMFSGWGIRTLSSASPNYNPMSYHNGSVWPHDNSLIAVGMCRYGFQNEAAKVITSTIEAGLRFPSNRLPELFCGFSRDRKFNSSPMSYIKSCSPQAWSAAAPFMMMQILLQLRPENGGQVLWVEPIGTDLFRRFHVEHLHSGAGRVTFSVAMEGPRPRIQLLGGDIALCSRSGDVISPSTAERAS